MPLQYFHIVLSTKNLLPQDIILQWLRKKSVNYIIALEHGANGHPHYDIYAELSYCKSSKCREAILSIYQGLVPLSEQRQVCVKENYIDPNPLFGIGYAAKEDSIIESTFDEFMLADSIKYYNDHRDTINQAKEKIREKHNGDILGWSVNRTVENFIQYLELILENYYCPETKVLKISVSTLVSKYIKEYIGYFTDKIKFETYQKINQEKLNEYVESHFTNKYYPSEESMIYLENLKNKLKEKKP